MSELGFAPIQQADVERASVDVDLRSKEKGDAMLAKIVAVAEKER